MPRSDKGSKHEKCKDCGHSLQFHYNIQGAGTFCKPCKKTNGVCSFDV